MRPRLPQRQLVALPVHPLSLAASIPTSIEALPCLYLRLAVIFDRWSAQLDPTQSLRINVLGLLLDMEKVIQDTKAPIASSSQLLTAHAMIKWLQYFEHFKEVHVNFDDRSHCCILPMDYENNMVRTYEKPKCWGKVTVRR